MLDFLKKLNYWGMSGVLILVMILYGILFIIFSPVILLGYLAEKFIPNF